MASKFIAPDISNATPSMLIDEMGKLSIMENQIKKLRAFYKEAFLARAGIKVDEMANGQEIVNTDGEIFVATTVRSDPQRVDVKKLQQDYPEITEEYLKQTPQLTTRFQLKEGVINPVVNDLINQMKQELDLD